MKAIVKGVVATMSAAVIGSGLVAQTVWTVTPPTFLATIAAAASGDIISMSPSSNYPSFSLSSKSLTILGNGNRLGNGSPVQIHCDPSDRVHIRGLRLLVQPTLLSSSQGTRVTVTGAGMTTFEDCAFGGHRQTRSLTTFGSNLVLQNCSVYGRYDTALYALDSNVTLRDCIVFGEDAFWYATGPFPNDSCQALVNVNGTLHAQNCTFIGGDGSPSPSNPTLWLQPSGAITNQNGEITLINCVVIGGVSPYVAPSLLNAGPTAQIAACTFSPPPSGAVNSSAPLVGLEVTPVWQRGSSSTVSVIGQPSALFGVWVATGLPTLNPFTVEPAWIDPSAGPALIAGALNANGASHTVIAIPNNPGLLHVPLWMQAVSGSGIPLHTSVLAGGLIQ